MPPSLELLRRLRPDQHGPFVLADELRPSGVFVVAQAFVPLLGT